MLSLILQHIQFPSAPRTVHSHFLLTWMIKAKMLCINWQGILYIQWSNFVKRKSPGMRPTKQPTACTQSSVQTVFKIQETYEQTNKQTKTAVHIKYFLERLVIFTSTLCCRRLIKVFCSEPFKMPNDLQRSCKQCVKDWRSFVHSYLINCIGMLSCRNLEG